MDTDQFIVDINESKDIQEINAEWNIPHYRVDKSYLHKFPIEDDLECLLMLHPIYEKEKGRDNKTFVRSVPKIVFQKLPKTDVDFKAICSFGSKVVSLIDFTKATLDANGHSLIGKNINTKNMFMFASNNFTVNVNLKMFIKKAMIKPDEITNDDSMLQDVLPLTNIDKFADFIIITSNNDEIRTQKALLSCRSTVFEKIFSENADMKQYKLNDDDSSKEVVEEFLKFLYTDRVENITINNTEGLFNLALKFKVPELIKITRFHLLYSIKSSFEKVSMNMMKIQNVAIVNGDKFQQIFRTMKSLSQFLEE